MNIILLHRYPNNVPITSLGDFMLFGIKVLIIQDTYQIQYLSYPINLKITYSV